METPLYGVYSATTEAERVMADRIITTYASNEYITREQYESLVAMGPKGYAILLQEQAILGQQYRNLVKHYQEEKTFRHRAEDRVREVERELSRAADLITHVSHLRVRLQAVITPLRALAKAAKESRGNLISANAALLACALADYLEEDA